MKVSCVIPVYNEANRVGAVIDSVIGHPIIDEIVVVNDGSTDGSLDVLREKSGICLISYDKNHGKSFAVMTGIGQCKNNLIMTLDSDLVGLSHDDISALAEPVVSGLADITFSMRKNSLPVFRLFGLDFVSGERVFHRKHLKGLDRLADLPGFGLEVFHNHQIIDQKLRLKVVPMPNTISPRKSKKFGWWQGTKGDLRMVAQIVSMLSLSGVASQFYRLRSLRVK